MERDDNCHFLYVCCREAALRRFIGNTAPSSMKQDGFVIFRICSMLTRIPLFMIRKRGSSCSCPAADLKVMRKRRSFPLETESII